MSSRGARIKNGHITTHEYHTADTLYDAKILEGNKGSHGLPDYSHSPNSIYIKQSHDGSFREMRVYDHEHYPILEIAYHGEQSLTGNRHEKILHYHIINRQFARSKAQKITGTIYQQYRKYLEAYGL